VLIKEGITMEDEKYYDRFTRQLEYLQELDALVEKKAKHLSESRVEDPYESKETKEINTALSKAQGDFPQIGPNRENPYFKNPYTDLNEVVKRIRPSLAKHGLSFTQQTILNDAGATILVTRLRHISGQYIETRARVVPAKNDAQTYGSALTYMKRYSLTTLLGVTVSKDPSDDDAEVEMVESRGVIAKGPSTKYNPKEQSFEPITKEQLEELEFELGEYPDIAEEVLDKMKIQSLADLPKSRFSVSIKRVREIKALRNGR
jgi:hypothetical protein